MSSVSFISRWYLTPGKIPRELLKLSEYPEFKTVRDP